MECFSFNTTYSPAHCRITQNEQADRLGEAGVSAAWKMIKEQQISLAQLKPKIKYSPLKSEKPVGIDKVLVNIKSIVPKIDQFTHK